MWLEELTQPPRPNIQLWRGGWRQALTRESSGTKVETHRKQLM